MVLRLPEKVWRRKGRTRSDRSNAQRVASLPFKPVGDLQQARGTETLNRIGCHSVTLKNPACYRNSQRRVA